jgi:hypothetical protein
VSYKIFFILCLVVSAIGYAIGQQQFQKKHDYWGLFWLLLGQGWLGLAIYASFKIWK